MTIDAATNKELNELKAEVARLFQTLDDYGRHKDWCISHDPKHDKSCTCGLDAARQRPTRKEGE